MFRKFLFVTILIFPAVAFHRPPAAKNFFIRQLAPGVWAAIQNDKGGHAISNAGIVDLGDKTLVFDAFINPAAALELKQVAEQLTKHPVSLLVNSHFHDDHIRGNQAFVPGAVIISTEWTRREMERVDPEEQEWARKNIAKQVDRAQQRLQQASAGEKDEDVMWLGYYEAIAQSLPKLRLTLPGITFRDSMWIHGASRSVELIECRNGHTGSDAVLVLPGDGIAFMGDILFVDRHPWLGDGDPTSWKKHLRHFYEDTALKKFVPGHGPLAGRESLQILGQYITDLEQMASEAIQKKEADSVFSQTAMPAKYKDWWYGRFYPDNLQAVYDEVMKHK